MCIADVRGETMLSGTSDPPGGVLHLDTEAATLSAQETVDYAKGVSMVAHEAEDVASAIAAITAQDPTARILICGSLYLAGNILRDNG